MLRFLVNLIKSKVFKFLRHISLAKKIISSLILLFLAGSWQPASAEPATGKPESSLQVEIKKVIAEAKHPYLKQQNFQYLAEELESLYKVYGDQPVWLGRKLSDKQIREIFSILESAPINGLHAADYDTANLRQQWAALSQTAKPDAKQQALFDTALSLALLRFGHHLHYGRINPASFNFNVKPDAKKLIDLPAFIKAHIDRDDLANLPALLEPPFWQYRELWRSLSKYRTLANSVKPLTFTYEKTIHPGDPLPNADELQHYLNGLGDLPETQDKSAGTGIPVYQGVLVEAVKHFQHRHGLTPDGVIGKSTVAALTVPLKQRILQIELAMERLRWLPVMDDSSLIIVNIPAFELTAYENFTHPDAGMLSMKVVVGKALKNQTPVLLEQMSFIDFLPFWNIPASIARAEVVPSLEKDGDYLAKQEMELVTEFGNQVKAVEMSEIALDAFKAGMLKVRQRPGKKNPLGRIKFIFPNQNNVYLHDTSAGSLFIHSRRDFSHGCVRVEKPDLLAEFVLDGQDGWTKEAILQAMNGDKTRRVVLKKPVPVLFVYVTADVGENNQLHFYQDIYGQDRLLQSALEKPQDWPVKSPQRNPDQTQEAVSPD